MIGFVLPDAPNVKAERLAAAGDRGATATDSDDGRSEDGASASAGGGRQQAATTPSTGTSVTEEGEAAELSEHCDPATGKLKLPSFYAPYCVPPWHGGDNGGSTWRGVTADEIVLVYYVPLPNPALDAILQAAGAADNADDVLDTVEVIHGMFSTYLETYGRTVRIEIMEGTGEAEDDQAGKADAIRAAEQLGAFMVIGAPNTTFVDELVSRNVLCFCTNQLPNKYYARWAPYVWSGLPSYEATSLHMAEYITKRLHGRTARWAGDAALRQQVRKFGLITIDTIDGAYSEGASFLRDELARRGSSLDTVVSFTFDLARAQEQSRTMLAKLKADGITSVVVFTDPIYPIFFTQEATRQRYFPEWLLTGSALTDTNFFGRTFDQSQWSHAFGIAPLPARTPIELRDTGRLHEWYAGYPPKAKATEVFVFVSLALPFYGIHYAGPNLTPHTFKDGWFGLPRPPNAGPTQMTLSFGNKIWPWDSYQAVADFTEIWWDPNAEGRDEIGQHDNGMYRFVAGGKRYFAGEWPESEPPAFNPEGTVIEYAERPPSDVPPDYPSPAR